MRRRFAAVLVVLIGGTTFAPAAAKNPTTRWEGRFLGPRTLEGGSSNGNTWPSRNYYVYEPPQVAAHRRSLVVFLHGTTQTATQAALASRFNDLADRHGFVVVYPEESTSATGSDTDGSNSARAWAWGRAAFEDRNNGEFRTIAAITKTVMRRYDIDPDRVYIAGLSAGAIMATVMAATYPDLYAASATWAGCSYMCSDVDGARAYERMGRFARVVPSIQFAGTIDTVANPLMTMTAVTGWTGASDLADDGQPNGSVSQTPTDGPTTHGADAASLTPAPNTGPDDGSRGDLGTCIYASSGKPNNPCPGGPLGWRSYPYTVTRFGYAARPSTVVVESWYIHGVSHNYPGGETEGTFSDPIGPDTTAAAWRFFRTHPR